MIEAYKELLDRDYDFKKKHNLSFICLYLGLMFLVLGGSVYHIQNNFKQTFITTNVGQGTIKTQELPVVKFEGNSQHLGPSSHNNYAAATNNALAIVYSAVDSSRITMFTTSVERENFLDFEGMITNFQMVDNKWYFLLKTPKTTKLMQVDEHGKSANMTSVMAGGDYTISSFFVFDGTFYFSSSSGVYAYKDGKIDPISKHKDLYIFGATDRVHLSDGKSKIYSIKDDVLKLFSEEKIILNPVVMNGNVYYYSTRPFGYNLIDAKTNNILYSQDEMFSTNWILNEFKVGDKIFEYSNQAYRIEGIDDVIAE